MMTPSLVYTIEKHLERLSLVLQRIVNAGMKLNLDKCSFLKQQVEYLGHIVDSNKSITIT